MAPKDDSFATHYARGLGMSTRNNSLAYGYSVAITATFGVLDRLVGRATVVEIFLFIAGASAAFALLNLVVTRGFQQRVAREPPLVVALATSLGVFSVSGGVGVAALLGWLVGGWIAWLVAPFAATVVYLVTSASEMAIARRAHLLAGTELDESQA